VSTDPAAPRSSALHLALVELLLTAIMLFLAVTVVRWLRDPVSPVYVEGLGSALVLIGLISGTILTALILSPLGARSGGHLNPAVTVALWLMGLFPGRRVAAYSLAQLGGSLAGTALARLAWGPAVARPGVAYAAISPAPDWGPVPVFVAELGGMATVILVVAVVLARPGWAHLVAPAVGVSVGVAIATLGPLSGGSINPARQLGPALLAGRTSDLAIYLVAPVLGAALGAGVSRLASQVRGSLRERGRRARTSST
jgi:glycerol uptake facilitator-like aquaporin